MAGFANYMVPVLIGAPDNNYSSKTFSTISHSGGGIGAYLAGLWEGDGHIWIPQTSHAPSNKRYTPHFCITFNALDHPLALELQSMLGGYLRNKEDNNAYVLTITNLADLANVIGLISPYVRTPKVNQLNMLMAWMNTNSNNNFDLVSPCTGHVLSDGWLAGFIDADGSFDIRVREKAAGHAKDRVEARFRLEQRMADPNTGDSYGPVLTLITDALGVKLNTIAHGGTSYYIIALTSPAKAAILINYLDNYPLFTSKFLNYSDYKVCVDLMNSKQHLTAEGRAKAKILQGGMNSTRTFYSWDHLARLGK